jgi:transcriptional regulator with XRE-family HTH domain
MDILDSLIEIRKQQKVKQTDLLSNLDINKDTMSRYESRKRKIPIEKLTKYAEFLGYKIRLIKD